MTYKPGKAPNQLKACISLTKIVFLYGKPNVVLAGFL